MQARCIRAVEGGQPIATPTCILWAPRQPRPAAPARDPHLVTSSGDPGHKPPGSGGGRWQWGGSCPAPWPQRSLRGVQLPSPPFPAPLSPALPGGKDCFCFSRQPVPSWHIWQGGGTGCLSEGILGCLFLQKLRLSPKNLLAAPSQDPRRWQSTRGRRGEITLLRPVLCRRDKDPRSSRMRTPWVPPLTSPKTLPSSTARGGGEGSRSWP